MQAGACVDGATAMTVENPPEHEKGLQRSLKGAGDSPFCSSALLAGENLF